MHKHLQNNTSIFNKETTVNILWEVPSVWGLTMCEWDHICSSASVPWYCQDSKKKWVNNHKYWKQRSALHSPKKQKLDIQYQRSLREKRKDLVITRSWSNIYEIFSLANAMHFRMKKLSSLKPLLILVDRFCLISGSQPYQNMQWSSKDLWHKK